MPTNIIYHVDLTRSQNLHILSSPFLISSTRCHEVHTLISIDDLPHDNLVVLVCFPATRFVINFNGPLVHDNIIVLAGGM